MNIDGMEDKAGLTASNIVRLHGNINFVWCERCNHTKKRSEADMAAFASGMQPRCRRGSDRAEGKRRALCTGGYVPQIQLYDSFQPNG